MKKIIIIALLLVAFLWGSLHLRWTQEKLAGLVSSLSGLEVERIEVHLPSVTLVNVRAEGLYADWIAFRWQPSGLLGRTWAFKRVRAGIVQLDEGEGGGSLEWPHLSWGILIGNFEIGELRMGNKRMALSGKVAIEPKGGDLLLQGAIVEKEMALTARIKGTSETKEISMHLKGRINNHRGEATAIGPIEAWNLLLTKEKGPFDLQLVGEFDGYFALTKLVHAKGAFILNGNRQIQISPLTMSSERAVARGQARIDLDGRIENAQLAVKIEELANFDERFEGRLEGNLTGHGRHLTFDFRTEQLKILEMEAQELRGQLETELRDPITGSLRATAVVEGVPLKLDAKLGIEGKKIQVTDMIARAHGSTITGEIAFTDRLEEAHLHADVQNLFSWSPLAKVEMEGTGKINATYRDHWTIEATSSSISVRGLEIENLDLKTEIVGELWPFTLNWDQMESQGRWNLETLTLDRFEGILYGYDLHLREPFALHWDKRLRFSPLDLEAGQGELLLSHDPITLQARNFPLTIVEFVEPRFAVDGTLNGHAQFANGEGNLHLSWDDVRLKNPLILDVGAIDGTIDGSLKNDRLSIRAIVDSEKKTPLKVQADIPIHGGPISGAATFRGQLAPLLQFMLPESIQMEGRVLADLQLSGTTEEPDLQGRLLVTEGALDDFTTGATLRELEGRLIARGSTLELLHFSATDGDGGTLEATGSISLTHHFPFSIDLHMHRAHLVQLDIATARFSGDLNFGGTITKPALTGALTCDRARINLSQELPASVPVLNVTYINAPTKIEETPTEFIPIQLDVDLNVYRNARVDGLGIRSEWHGDVKLTGTLQSPLLYGNLSMMEGTFDLAGKEFELTQGSVTFEGPPGKNYLDLVGTIDTFDIEINANLTGQLPDNLALTFYSAPPLPEKDILSYVLFGGPVTELAPAQAVQLAQASTEMSRGKYGIGIINSFQQGIGLDQFTIITPEGAEEEYGILAGKRFTPDVGVSVYRSINTEHNRTRVVLELWRQLRFQGEVGNEDGERFSLLWKKNY